MSRNRRQNRKKLRYSLLFPLILFCSFLVIYITNNGGVSSLLPSFSQQEPNTGDSVTLSYDAIPPYTDSVSWIWNHNTPSFSQADFLLVPGSYFSELDSLGRSGTAMALLGPETMPQEPRESIGPIEPSGWHTIRYDDRIEDHYLYNRCHLIAYQLAGDNADPRNLITGTRYFNVSGMLPYETQVASYLYKTGNHVLYRVTPIYKDNALVAYGVQMEAESLEDNGRGISFNVFVYNIQPGVIIDYQTGDSWADSHYVISEPKPGQSNQTAAVPDADYVLNTWSMKFHLPSCDTVADMSSRNLALYEGSREELLEQGYEPCRWCKP